MTQTLHVPTMFQDLNELAQDFSQRVNGEVLMLPYSAPQQPGEWVTFVVALADGTSGLEGTGRVKEVYENEDYPPEYRYEIELDMLQFDGRSEVMYERILMVRESQAEGGPATGEVDVAALERQAAEAQAEQEQESPDQDNDAQQEDFSDHTHMGDENSLANFGAAPASMPPVAVDDAEDAAGLTAYGDAPEDAGEAEASEAEASHEWDQHAEGGGEDHTGDHVADEPEEEAHEEISNLQAAVPSDPPPAPAARSVPPGPRSVPPAPPKRVVARASGIPAMHTFEEGILLRPAMAASWSPTVQRRPARAQSSGLFDYTGALPRPVEPPRPAIDESARVAPAPTREQPWTVTAADPGEAPAQAEW